MTQITLPNSKESEMMVLGCMLSNSESLSYSADSLNEADFFYNEHKVIFSTINGMHANSKVADVHLVCEELNRQSLLKVAGGVSYIVTLVQFAGTSAYINELKILSTQRKLVEFAQQLKQRAVYRKEHPSNIVSDAQEAIKLIEKYNCPKDNFPIRFLHQFEKNFLLIDPPKKQMLLECLTEDGSPIGFLPKGIVAMLVGAGGIGKTHLLAQLTLSIATGTPFLGKFTTNQYCGEDKQGTVFLDLGENQYEDIHRILYKSAKKLRDNQSDFLRQASERIAAFSFCGQQAAFLDAKKPSQYFRELKHRLEDKAPLSG